MQVFLFLLVILICATGTVLRKKLTPAAAVTGCGVAACCFFGTGPAGAALMAAFFILATVATAVGKEGRAGEAPRTAAQVVANGGFAALVGIVCLFFPLYTPTGLLITAAAFSSATADTVSSELGTVWGGRFYDVWSWKPGRKGENGVVSVEGTVCGLVGSVAIATVYAAFAGWGVAVFWIVVAGTAGNFADSLLGAVWERKGYIGNNAVNFLNTAVAAAVVWLAAEQLA